MSDKNRNRSSSNSSDENWNQQQEGRYDQQNKYGESQYGNVNYDRDYDRNRDRNRNYGSTGYSGSNYGNYSGASSGYNQQVPRNFEDYGSEYTRRNYGSNQDQWNQSSNYGQYGRRDRDEPGNDYNRNYGGGYGSSANYGSGYSGSNYGNYDRDRNYGNESYYGNTSGSTNYGRNMGANRGNWGNRNEDRGWWDKTRDEVSSWFGDEDAERRRRIDQTISGQHKGKGPRDYRRSDERILEDACDRLSEDSFVDASDIDVKVTSSEVVLTGTVESREAKRRAEDIVESISGVSNVQNNLKVNTRSDSSGLRSSYRE